MSLHSIQLEQLFKLRLSIARLGEMDNMGWWNTQGVLGADGSFVYQRGFPATHYFTQAKVVFAVAKHRCQEAFTLPNCSTLWQLPTEIEDQFEDRWQDWLHDSEQWQPYFESIASVYSRDVEATLRSLEIINESDLAKVKRNMSATDGHSLALPLHTAITDETVRLLSAAFVCALPGKLIVPYVSLT